MTIKYFQKGFNYSQDGPGNRLVYHLHGCNMKCPWCSNPEGMKADAAYPAFPITQVTVEDMLSEIISCKPMFFDGGGVTLTGGEVTLQADAVRELLKRLKDEGINTAIETNAMSPALPTLFPFLDHLIMDVKSADEDKLLSVAGGVLYPILKNLKAAVDAKLDILVHVPLINGFNADEDATDKLLQALLPFKDDIRIEFLAYHEYGKDKWKQCGLVYAMENANISTECYKKTVSKFKAAGFTAVRT
ncbi:MAG: radical SAM protein [Clostridia bacterium]|nr:radical SAM protein [Clostridia bacterium]